MAAETEGVIEPVDEPGEEWREIEGYEGLYEVSSLGRVRSLDQVLNRKNGTVRWPGRVLKSQRGSKGHYGVNLHQDGRSVTKYIHRLVALAFLPNPNGFPLVRHLDDVKENNTLSNLAWGTHSDNAQDVIRNDGTFNRQAEKTHCPYGHPYTGVNLYISPNGARHCRECKARRWEERGQEWAAQRRAKGLVEGDPRHGTVSGYTNYGCRCSACSDARRDSTQNRKKREGHDGR